MAQTQVRLARPQEYDRIGDLTVRAYQRAGALTAGDDYASVLADVAGRAAHAEVYVALDSADVVGTVTLCPHSSAYAQVTEPRELEFRMLAVDPERSGEGHGGRLISFCDEQARARGLDRLVLCVIDANVSALRLYDHLGFQRVPERDRVPRPGINLLTLTRAVGGQDGGPRFCDHCGGELNPSTPSGGPAADHERCRAARTLEPPRFCPWCRRRMVVQVTPAGWVARCSEHGETTG